MPRVLVVDDSALMRQFLCDLLGKERDFELATAQDGRDALRQLKRFQPDVITLDLNMPAMDGLTTLAHIMTERPTPVVVVSSISQKSALPTLEALALGAVDYIPKPDGTISLQLEEVADQVRAKVRAACKARISAIPAALPVSDALPVLTERHKRTSGEDRAGTSAAIGRSLRPGQGGRASRAMVGPHWGTPGISRPGSPPPIEQFTRFEPDIGQAAPGQGTPSRGPNRVASGSGKAVAAAARREATQGAQISPALAAHADLEPGYPNPEGAVLIGVSTGGPRILPEILRALSPQLPWPVVIAQHMPDSFTESFARRLDDLCPLPVREAREDMPLKPGHVYLARGGFDLGFTRRNQRIWLQVMPERPGLLWHPSVEHLVKTAMDVFAPTRLIGVMLTGMGYDGAESMARLKNLGGRTVAESKDSAIVYGMPKELIERNGATAVVPYPQIAPTLHQWLKCAP